MVLNTSQDMKWSSHFTAEYFNILSSDFYLEPSALVDVSGRGYHEGGPGTTTVKGAGAGHATVGGTGKFAITGLTKKGTTQVIFGHFYLVAPRALHHRCWDYCSFP